MKQVAETHHLQKRGNFWHYYRRVPKSLVSVIGKSFIKKSLGTQDLKSAKNLRNVLNVRYDAEFAEAENAANTPVASAKPVTLSVLQEYIRRHVQTLDQCSAARSIASPPD